MKLCNRDKNLNVNLSIVAIAKVPQKSDSSDKRRTERECFLKHTTALYYLSYNNPNTEISLKNERIFTAKT